MEMLVEKIGDVAVAMAPGESLDAGNAKNFKKEMEPFLLENKYVVFDMSDLQFVDSSGLGAILSCLRKVKDGGGDLRLCSLRKTVRVLFELVRMHRIFDIYNTREEAIRSFEDE